MSYGKTSVLSEWASGDDRPLAWVGLERADNDPAALVRSIVEELERTEPFEPEVIAALSGPEPSISTIVLPRLGRALARRRLPFLLVLDDVHLLRSPEALETVTALADHLPRGGGLALASRTEPPLRLGRMRAHGRLLELRQGDLAMTRSEARALLESMGLEIADAAIQRRLEALEDCRQRRRNTTGWSGGHRAAG